MIIISIDKNKAKQKKTISVELEIVNIIFTQLTQLDIYIQNTGVIVVFDIQ